jgi:hypothetical protein
MTKEEAELEADALRVPKGLRDAYIEACISPISQPIDSTDIEPEAAILHVLSICRHSLVVLWRIGLRRWYVFSDRPTWVVRLFAIDFRNESGPLGEAAKQAAAELAVRLTKKAAA